MFAVVTLKNSRKNVVVPYTWIDGIKMHEFGNDGCSSTLPLKIYYSTDERKQANFSLNILDYYEDSIPDSCYIAFLRNFFGKNSHISPCFNKEKQQVTIFR